MLSRNCGQHEYRRSFEEAEPTWQKVLHILSICTTLEWKKMSPQGWYIYFVRGKSKTCAMISPQHVLPQLWLIKTKEKSHVTSPLKAHVAFQFPCFLLFTVRNVGSSFHCSQADYCSNHRFQDVWIQKNKPFPRWVFRKRSRISALVLLCLGAYQLMHEARIK